MNMYACLLAFLPVCLTACLHVCVLQVVTIRKRFGLKHIRLHLHLYFLQQMHDMPSFACLLSRTHPGAMSPLT